MHFKLWLESAAPFVAYHQTSAESAAKIKKSRRFSLKKSTQGIIWFTNDIESLRNNTTGAGDSGAILKIMVDIQKPAGWQEYHNLMLGQLRREYDGAILPDEDGTFDGFVFNPKKIKILGIVSLDDLTESKSFIHFITWANDGTIVALINGKRFKYMTDAVYHERWKKMAHYRPGSVLNEIKKLVSLGKASVEGPY